MRKSVLALVLTFVSVLGGVACVAEIDAADEDGSASAETEQGLAEKRNVVLWSPTFPSNPNGTPATETVMDVVAMGGCKYSSVVHQVTFQRTVGLKVEAILPGSCQLTSVLGGRGYLAQGSYNGPYAYARIQRFVPLGRLAFVSSGSAGPSGSAQGTMPTLNVRLIDALSGVVLRSTTQSVCAAGPGAQIRPDGAIQLIGQAGTLTIAGTKNASTGLPGDGPCPGGGALTAFTLGYAGFATGTGPVAAPTVQ